MRNKLDEDLYDFFSLRKRLKYEFIFYKLTFLNFILFFSFLIPKICNISNFSPCQLSSTFIKKKLPCVTEDDMAAPHWASNSN